MLKTKIIKKFIAFLLAGVVGISFVGSGNVCNAWSSDKWNNYDVSGHKSYILSLGDSYFNYHTSIVAVAAYNTDDKNYMSASANTGTVSPYHAKTEYTLSQVKTHARFLYELAQKSLISKQELPSAFVAKNYTYISSTVGKRIISDLNDLKGETAGISDTEDTGYMILGVYLHLLQDIYCHRAAIKSSTVTFTLNDNGTTDDTVSDMKINPDHINYSGTIKERKAWLKKKIGTSGIAMIRLKDHLKKDINYTYGGISYTDKDEANAVYEDNPFYYTDRYDCAKAATVDQIGYLMASEAFEFYTKGLSLK